MDQAPLDNFREHSSLCVGVGQEVLAVGDPVSGSGAAEPLFDRRRGRGKADAEAHRGPRPLGQSERCAADSHALLRSEVRRVLASGCQAPRPAHRSTNSRCLPAPMVRLRIPLIEGTGDRYSRCEWCPRRGPLRPHRRPTRPCRSAKMRPCFTSHNALGSRDKR